MRNCLIIFAKEPESGKVKTRLEGCLSREECVKLYKAFIKDTVEAIRNIKGAYVILAYDATAPEPEYLKRAAGGLTLYRQKGNDLGQKMHNVFKFAEKRGAFKKVIIGTDSPNLPFDYINDAFDRLDRCDVVLGPSFDGGYYLVGLKKPCLSIFKGVIWGSDTVLERTAQNAFSARKRIDLLDPWYDVDTPSGLARLRSDLIMEKNTARWTKKLLKI